MNALLDARWVAVAVLGASPCSAQSGQSSNAVEWKDAKIGICRSLTDSRSGPLVGEAFRKQSDTSQFSTNSTSSVSAVGLAIRSLNGELVPDVKSFYAKALVSYVFGEPNTKFSIGLTNGRTILVEPCMEGLHPNGESLEVDQWSTPVIKYLLYYFVSASTNSELFDVRRTSEGVGVYRKRGDELIETYTIYQPRDLMHVIEGIDVNHRSQYETFARATGRSFRFVDSDKGNHVRLVIFHGWPGTGVRGVFNTFISQARSETKRALEVKAQILDQEWRDDRARLCSRQAPPPRDREMAEVRKAICGS